MNELLYYHSESNMVICHIVVYNYLIFQLKV